MKKQKSTIVFGGGILVALVLALTINPAWAGYEGVVLADNPIAFYALNPAADPSGISPDLTTNGNDGTDYNLTAATGPTAYITNAAYFDGNAAVDLSMGNNPDILNFSGPITLEAWVQPSSPAVFGDIIAKGYDASLNYDEIVLRANGTANGGIYYGDSGSAGVGGGFETTNWAYVVLSSDGTNCSLYVNGTLVQSTPDANGAINFSDPWRIGTGSANGTSRYFNGNISQAAIYNYGISANQVYNHYFAGEYGTTPSNAIPIITAQPVSQVSYIGGSATFQVTVLSALPTTNQWYKNGNPMIGQTNGYLTLTNVQNSAVASYSVTIGNSNGTTNSASANLTLQALGIYDSTVVADQPLAYYPLDPDIDAGGAATDLSGNGNNATYYNTSPGFNSVPGPTSFITNAAEFNGSTYADVGNIPLLNFGGQITLEAWVQPANTSGNIQDILAKGYDSSATPYDAEIVLRQNSTVYSDGNASGGTAAAGSWAYVVSTYDGTNWNLYENGVLVAQAQNSTGAINFSDPWRIGSGSADGSSRLFTGNISQVALYNYGLTAAQVLAHYFVGVYGVSPSNSVPIILTQPQPQSTYTNGTATFSVSVLSVLPTTNLWFKNGNPLNGQTNATLVLNNVQADDVANYSVVVGNSNGTTNSAAASLSILAPGDTLQWRASDNSGVWDTGSSQNWIDLSDSQQVVFNTSDGVLFDDTPDVPTSISINGSVSPSVIIVNSSTNNFTVGGSGQISGAGSLVKNGSSTLTLNTAGNFTGSVTVGGGTLADPGNTLASVFSIAITNGGTLDFDGSTMAVGEPFIVSGDGVNGEGALFNSGNSPAGQILNITLFGNTTFGNAGSNNRWDLVAGSSLSGALEANSYSVKINNANGGYGEWDTVMIATNIGDMELVQGSWGLKGLGAGVGDPNKTITVDPGCALTVWGSSVGPNSGYDKNIHVETNGQFGIRPGVPNTYFNANVALESNVDWYYYNGGGSGQTLNGTYTLNDMVHLQIGDSTVTFTNVISGPGGFVWDSYNNETVFEASNTYSGPTVIGGGLTLGLSGQGSISKSSLIFFGGNNVNNNSLDVSGRSDRTLTLASGQILAGIGGINGSLVVSPGATISPAGTNTMIGITSGANSTGTLAAANNITLNGTTIIKLNGSGTNDMVQAGANIACGGTLNLANISGSPLAAGNSFQIFNATAYSGLFANITPATPGPGLAWNTNGLAVNGTVTVVSSALPKITSIALSGTTLTIVATNGPVNTAYVLLESTNVALPLAQWTPVLTNTFDGNGNLNLSTNVINPNNPMEFYILQTQ